MSLVVDLAESWKNSYKLVISRVDSVSENERKRSLNLQIDLPENLTKNFFGTNVPWKLHTKREII